MASRESFYLENYAAPLSSGTLEHRLQTVLKIFSDHRGELDRILDVGCGDGSFSARLKGACGAGEVFGLEISPLALGSLAPGSDVRVIQSNVDTQDFPFPNEHFDAIFCGELIEHLYDPDHLLEEMYRTLQTGGMAVVTTPNLASWHNRIALFAGYQPHATEVSLRHNVGKLRAKPKRFPMSGHIRVFTPRALRELVVIHGFRVVQLRGASAYLSFPFPANMVERVSTLVPSVSSHLVLTIRK